MVRLIEVTIHNNIAKTYICVIAKGNMDVYAGNPFYITIANLGNVDVQLPSYWKVYESANGSIQIFNIKYKRYSYHFDGKACNIESFITVTHFITTRDLLEEMAKHGAVTEKIEKTLTKDSH